MSNVSTSRKPEIDFNTPAMVRNRRFRAFKNQLASRSIAAGGLSIIVAILLIFFYLLWEIVPLFKAAQIEHWPTGSSAQISYKSPGGGQTIYLAIEEQAKIGLRISDAQKLVFFDSQKGNILLEHTIKAPAGVKATSIAMVSEASRIFAIGFDNGSVKIFKHEYTSTYPDGVRIITPSISYPLGEEPINVAPTSVEQFAISNDEENWSIVAGSQKQFVQTNISAEENLLTEEVEVTTQTNPLAHLPFIPSKVLLLPGQRWMLATGEGEQWQGKVALIDMQATRDKQLSQMIQASAQPISSFSLLLGGNSLIIGDVSGVISQWFLVRDDNNQWSLQKIRQFEGPKSAIADIAMEQRRKGFAAIDKQGFLHLFNTTANRIALSVKVANEAVTAIAYAPRSNALLIEQNGEIKQWSVDNEHPDISWQALWEKVWYEGYQEPEYIWQSSASNNDFEPKYSLMPLAFGTLKAAFYAMLLATPLAICGAIYTAYFMAPAMRKKVKPLIELMEALPTVILGFLAGLWLAPFIENNLAGIFVTLLGIPIAILGFGFGWANLPKAIRNLVPNGWDAALLIPVVILATLISLQFAQYVEVLIFGGDMRQWITDEVGIPFDQRNALVVGIAMGFAVIPTIFTITEDAIFSVPKHLSYGSLALGATPWQP